LSEGKNANNLKKAADELNKALELVDNIEFPYKKEWDGVTDILSFTKKEVNTFTNEFLKTFEEKYNMKLDKDTISSGITNKIMMEVSLNKKEWI
jgi:hypothetical protein